MIGEKVSHYKIIDKLGSGGMGEVYRAEDIKLKRTVALKFLPPSFSFNEEAKKRFVHEAQSASALDHPNICTIYEIDETKDGRLFISMPCYEGETLKEKIAKGPLEVDDAANIILQICNGMEKAHKAGIIHRDIKPANIFITNDGIVKILDFGLAKVNGQTKITQIGTTLGTINYMSPEQAKGEEVDQRTDIWSLGAVIYEMLTGQLPFKADYEQAVIYSIINSPFEPVKNIRSEIPDKFETIIEKALNKNPELRYNEISDLKNDLGFRGKSIGITQSKKSRKLFAYLTSLSILIVAFIIVFFSQKETIPFSKRDWVLISDFENQTEQKVLDKSLYTAFVLSIDQSRYVNVVSKRRMMENLKRMEKPDLNFLDEETIREMALREGINIYLVPGISKIGNKYIITCMIKEAANAEMLKSEVLYAVGENDILDKLDNLSRSIREDLGESSNEISRQNKPLRKVTTSSLEALKQYSLGIEEHWKSNFEKAKYYYENALKIDSTFTSAKASLGNLLLEKFDRKQGKKLLSEAIKSIDKVTNREKYGILAFYAVNVEGNWEEGIKYTKLRSELYPDDPAPHNNLGWYYQNTGRYNEAVEEYKTALKIDPHLILTYGGVIWTYLEKLGMIDSAFVWTKKMLNYDDTNAWGYFYLGSVYTAMDSLASAEHAYQKAVDIYPNFTVDAYRLAHVYRLQGRFQKAINILQKILKNDKEEISAHYDLGINYSNLGNNKSSKEHFTQFRKAAEKWVKENP
ncbi:MAG: protein kinase, partial [Ignavibacteriaceae bacterium]